ncbi:dipeptide/oligopeptide/nickel ABC transporter permease/ATP-binding protein (plasmid) [Embleya sp. NBC_00888]|uniref:dipeptide/oligopeptide/nickel ABC transporter permease/ATP-binding protein n=1 Tax=Embleya sp. NBC_00888 TaxID=2975960 RepID=UPI002F90D986|nr:dipeptide/oligopeptide/nickel ABC transporter permease/ATP-binding protein [Embleya sp. NBC_00888]
MNDNQAPSVAPPTAVLPAPAPAVGVEPAPGAPHAGPRRRGPAGRFARDPVAVTAAAVLLFVVVTGAGAGLIAEHGPNSAALHAVLADPSGKHPLGGDGSGRDVLSRLLYGSRTSLLAGSITTCVALLIGVPTGLVAGYVGGWWDTVSSWVANVFLALPGIVVLLALVAVHGPGLAVSMIVLGVLTAAPVFRLVRGEVRRVRGEPYVDAARVAGLSDLRIMRRHILRVVRVPIITQASLIFGLAMIIESGIAFLGLGEADRASWGAMLGDASTHVYDTALLSVWPGAAITLTVLAVTLLGAGLRDAFGDAPRPVRAPRRRTIRGAARGPGRATEAASTGVATPAGTTTVGTDVLLSVEGLRVAYPTPDGEAAVVDTVSLTVHRGEIVGLVGESGCGKTQTALAVLRLLPAGGAIRAGRVEFDGQDLATLSERGVNALRGRRIGYIPQDPMSNLDPSFRIGGQLTEPLRAHLGLSRDAARRRALELLDRVGITDPPRVFDAYPHQISGGMAQRVLIACAVACEPDLLIADEPTTALDVTVQAEILDLLRSLQREHDMGVVLVTHDLGVVADLCDRVAVMYAGEIVETATSADLFARPAHPYTAALLAAIPPAEGGADRGPLRTIPDRVPSVRDRPTGCRFAPRCAYAAPECAVHPQPSSHGTGAVRCARVQNEVIAWTS